MDSEAVWIERARRGDAEAFGRLVELYQTPVYNLAFRMMGDAAEASDAAQEAFVRAYLRLSSYDAQRPFKTWLLSITSHYCIDLLRKRRQNSFSLDDPELPPHLELSSQEAGPEETALEREQQRAVQAMLAGLAPEDRAMVVFRYWYDLSYEEIADTLHTTVSAVKSRLFRARRAMSERAGQRPVLEGAMSGAS